MLNMSDLAEAYSDYTLTKLNMSVMSDKDAKMLSCKCFIEWLTTDPCTVEWSKTLP